MKASNATGSKHIKPAQHEEWPFDKTGNDYDGNDDFDVDQPARVIPVRMMPNEERMIGMRAKAEDQEIYCTCAKKRNIIDKMK